MADPHNKGVSGKGTSGSLPHEQPHHPFPEPKGDVRNPIVPDPWGEQRNHAFGDTVGVRDPISAPDGSMPFEQPHHPFGQPSNDVDKPIDGGIKEIAGITSDRPWYQTLATTAAAGAANVILKTAAEWWEKSEVGKSVNKWVDDWIIGPQTPGDVLKKIPHGVDEIVQMPGSDIITQAGDGPLQTKVWDETKDKWTWNNRTHRGGASGWSKSKAATGFTTTNNKSGVKSIAPLKTGEPGALHQGIDEVMDFGPNSIRTKTVKTSWTLVGKHGKTAGTAGNPWYHHRNEVIGKQFTTQGAVSPWKYTAPKGPLLKVSPTKKATAEVGSQRGGQEMEGIAQKGNAKNKPIVKAKQAGQWAGNREGDLDFKSEEFGGRINTVLEQRSYLDFYFNKPLALAQVTHRVRGKPTTLRRVCMFENPEITETRAPKYAKRDIIQRNEPVRLFVGADVRKVKVKFNYTLPHVTQFFNEMIDQGFHPPGFESHTEYIANAQTLLNNTLKEFFGQDFKVSDGSGITKFYNPARSKGPYFVSAGETIASWERIKGVEANNKHATASTRALRSGWGWTDTKDLFQPVLMAAYYTQFVLDTIRASVLGDTLDSRTTVGPPIVRFRHGTVFNAAPFIVRNFTIDYVKTGGYEPRTLLPRIITITLDLEEFRQLHGSHHGELDFNEKLPGANDVLDLVGPPRGGHIERGRYWS